MFNDPALAVHYFLRRGMRVAYVDVDAHHGDGVQEAFFGDDRVLTISVHESGRYLFPGTGFVTEQGEGRGRGYSVNLPLFPYTGDEVYLDSFRQIVPPLLRAFAPDVMVTQLGIDSYHSDPLTHLQLTTTGFCGSDKGVCCSGPAVAGLGWRRVRLDGGGEGMGPGLRSDAGSGVARHVAEEIRTGARDRPPAGQRFAGGAREPEAGHSSARGRNSGGAEGTGVFRSTESQPDGGFRGEARFFRWSSITRKEVKKTRGPLTGEGHGWHVRVKSRAK